MIKSKIKVKILIAYHKNTRIFKSDILVPIQVGKVSSKEELKMIGDDTGDNISSENNHYCELTAIYWAWKNYDKLDNPDYIGLAHYRRFLHFNHDRNRKHNIKDEYSNLFDSEEIVKQCISNDLILPNKNSIQNSKFEPMDNLYEQYKSDHIIENLDQVEKLVKKKFSNIYPSYVKTIYENDYVYWCNMFVFSKHDFFEYCSFLFPILNDVKKSINFNDKRYDKYQSRVLGFLSERLLNVYIQYLKDRRSNIKILELPVLNIDEYFLNNLNKSQKIKSIYSFDVFDTLITRMTGDPVGVFSYMEALLKRDNCSSIPKKLIENFSFLRQESETFVRNSWRQRFSDHPSRRDEQDITIDDIYDKLQDFYQLSKKQVHYLKNLELDCEQQLIIPINKNIQKIINLSEDNTKKVILISDTYLFSNQIRKILSNIHSVFKDITIYTSSEVKKAKWSGDLFKYIKDKEGINAKNWIHTGDNIHSDVYMARHNGIEAVHFEYPHLLDWENRLLQYKTHHNLSAQVITGLEKNVRLFHSHNDKNTFGGSFAAPLLMGYLEFIMQEARKNKLQSLYFLARDGYILKKMADVIIQSRNYSIKTHYLYSSRKAWRNPSIIEDFPDGYFTNQWLFDSDNIKSCSDLSKFFGIEWAEFKKFLPNNFQNKNCTLNEVDLKNLSNKLRYNENFKTYFLNYCAKKRKLVQNYLKQEIDTDELFGIVDLYGLGLTQDCFNRILNDMMHNTQYLYFTFKNESPRYNNLHSRQYQPFGHCFWILEPLLRAPHGQTMGYEERNGVVRPVLELNESSSIINWGLNDYIDGIISFVTQYEKLIKTLNVDINFVDVFLTHYESIWHDKFIVDMIGSIPFDVRVGTTVSSELAPKITLKQAYMYVLTGKYPDNLTWIHGSLIRTDDNVKRVLPLRRFINGENKFFRPLKRIVKEILKQSI